MSVVLVTFPGAPKVSQEAIQEVSSPFTLLVAYQCGQTQWMMEEYSYSYHHIALYVLYTHDLGLSIGFGRVAYIACAYVCTVKWHCLKF